MTPPFPLLSFAPALALLSLLGSWVAWCAKNAGWPAWSVLLTSLPLTLCWSAMVKWGKGTVIEATVVYDAVTTVAYAAVLFGMGERLSPLGALGAALAVTGVVLLHLG